MPVSKGRAASRTSAKPSAKKQSLGPHTKRRKAEQKWGPSVVGVEAGSNAGPFERELTDFMQNQMRSQFLSILDVIEEQAPGSTSEAAQKSKSKKKVKVEVPASMLTGKGSGSERMMMQRLGWYWEPMLFDLNFYEEMRDSIPLIDGEVQKFLDIVFDGFSLHCGDEADPQVSQDLQDELLNDQDVDLLETLRNAALDIYFLGNVFKVPKWKTDDKGRKTLKTLKPVRASAMRALRDEDLILEGFVQLLHRPSEFLVGNTPSIPTIWKADEVLWGKMRTYGWYAYGRPLPTSLPFVLKIKLQMEKELAEMLHQHLPRVDIIFTPDQQMNQEQVDEALTDVKTKVAKLKANDNFAHTPDTTIAYIGPGGHALNAESSQSHIESQHFYIFPLSPAIQGLDSTANPFDSQQRWSVMCMLAGALRTRIEHFIRPVLKVYQTEWKLPAPITFGWSQLDPERQSTQAQADEYQINNAAANRDHGFIDQDTAAQQATSNRRGGPVKKAAAPGEIPPPTPPGDPTSPSPKVQNPGPKRDGTKVPAPDKRPKGKRHSLNMALLRNPRVRSIVAEVLEKLAT